MKLCRKRCNFRRWWYSGIRNATKGRRNDRRGGAATRAQWSSDERWSGIERTYTAEQVVRLRGSVVPEHTLAKLGAERLWELLRREEPTRALGALTGGQAVQMVSAGLDAIYLSGWQVAADANLAGSTYPDQSLYPVNSVPSLVRRLNNALLRADQIDWAEERSGDALARADRRRRRGRLRRPAQRVRADEVR